MTLRDTTAPSETGSISFELELDHAPSKVWRALTEPALLTEWLLPIAGLDLTPGAPFTFQAPPQPEWDGVVNCRFVEIDAQRKLVWTWVVGDIDTVVTVTLTPTASGTHLALVHSGFKAHQKQNSGGARYGWRMMSDRLVDLLARIR